MGDIKPGQSVCNPNGTVSKILSIYRPGHSAIWKITFGDGSTAVCDDEHIWLGHWVGHIIKRGITNKLCRFGDIRAKFNKDKIGRFLIPLTSPVVMTRPRNTVHGDMRPVDPYALGVLLGDGCLTGDSIRYATEDDEIDAYMAQFGTVRVDDGPNRRLVFAPEMLAGLRKVGAWKHGAATKRVPNAYMWAPIADRWRIIQGLLDTDGTVDTRGQVYFTSISEGLAQDVRVLAWSLGFKASIWMKKTTHSDAYNVYIQGPNRERLFALPRKRKRARQRSGDGVHTRRIISIEPAGMAEVGCFQVDDPNGLFITRDFVVTHNTDGVMGKWARKESIYGPNFNAIMFRLTTTASEDAIERSIQIYSPLGGKFNESKLVWKMPHGGRIRFSYLRTIADADLFQGKNLTDAWTDEGGQYPDPAPIDRLFGALRSAHGVPIQLIITANPGGPGQAWIADRYKLIPLPLFPKIVERLLPDGAVHRMAVIPSRITDNRIGLRGDPGYVSRLHLSGSKNLVRAWLEGDWNAVEGAYFDCWSEKIVIEPFKIPSHWTRFRSYDWGSAAPFSVGWWAVADGETAGIPKGAMVRYREWYGRHKEKPTEGLRLVNKLQAKGILERQAEGEEEKIVYTAADPSVFNEDGGPSIAEQFAKGKVYFTKADNTRIAGWSEMRLRITGSYGKPMMYCFSTCEDSIRTIPTLPHSIREPEDLDTDSEDHAADDWRYACMSRPWVSEELPAAKKPDRWAKKFNQRKGSGSWR